VNTSEEAAKAKDPAGRKEIYVSATAFWWC
jgi:hypothetical protein